MLDKKLVLTLILAFAAAFAVACGDDDGGSPEDASDMADMAEDTTGEEFEAFYEKLRHRAEKKMSDLLTRWEEAVPAPEARILFGKRAPEIVRFAVENDVSLIVVSSHAVDTQDATRGWGTISYEVAIMAPCPVMMVK